MDREMEAGWVEDRGRIEAGVAAWLYNDPLLIAEWTFSVPQTHKHTDAHPALRLSYVNHRKCQ